MLAVSRLICFSLTPAKFSVLANFWALSEALVISPDRPMNASMALPATLCAMPVMTPSFAPKPPAKPLPALMPAVLPAVSDALPNADSMALPTPFMLGTTCTNAVAISIAMLCLPDGGARCGQVCGQLFVVHRHGLAARGFMPDGAGALELSAPARALA